ncbi:MAG: family 10 glycosylhydrolase [Clostridia bacterium]|nr:family 10 glycosylhydrolase [Clostridia bacterium]
MARHVRKGGLLRRLALLSCAVLLTGLAVLLWYGLRPAARPADAFAPAAEAGAPAATEGQPSTALPAGQTTAPQTSTTVRSAVTTATTVTTTESTTATTTESTTATTTESTTATTTERTSSTTTTATATTTTTATQPTQPPEQPVGREMRGVWLSYIELDALLKGKDPAQARAALDGVMETCKTWGLNTLFLHVRSASNAYYASARFRAAETVRPLLEQGFDPLDYAVRAAHGNGLQLHAWINPYRAGRDAGYLVDGVPYVTDTAGTYPVYYYLPSAPESRALILEGIGEVLAYGVDGVQFDDYFYPQGVFPAGAPLPQEQAAYQADGGADVAAWRRGQVSGLLRQVYALAHAHGAVFGVSPSALLDTAYDRQYADVRTWLSAPGYADYICPQLYFGFLHESRPFAALLAQWQALPRDPSVALCGGLAVSKVGVSPDAYAGSGCDEWLRDVTVLTRQVQACRAAGAGFCLYSYTYLSENSWRSTAPVTVNGQSVTPVYDKTVAAQALGMLQEEIIHG